MTAQPEIKTGAEEAPGGKKDKQSFSSKVVIRRLPASMTEEEFRTCVDPLPPHDYFRFVKADFTFEQDACARAYINFLNEEDIFTFRQQFDGYVFLDNKGNEHEAVVEFAPYQKVVAAKETRKRDPKINTLDQDADYIKFLEILASGPEVAMPTVEQVLEEIEAREREMRKVDSQTTPLLQFMRDRKDEKVRKREEQREARKKKEEERRRRMEEERQRRKELKEKEIRDKERREKEKGGGEEQEGKKEEASDADRKKKREVEDKEQKIKEKREREREKRREREEREKEQFRKREEERQRKREEKRRREEEEFNKKKGDEEGVKGAVDVDEGAEEAKSKRYSDKRKEERLRREKERQEKLSRRQQQQPAGVNNDEATANILSVEDAAASLQELTIQDRLEEKSVKEEKSAKDDKDQEKERIEEDRRALEKREREERAAERKRERDLERAERKRNKERPDMQIYRPGMGKFSSRTIKIDDKVQSGSTKTSPDDSRETSPSRLRRSSGTASPEKKEKRLTEEPRKKKETTDEKNKRYITREFYSKMRKEREVSTESVGGTTKEDSKVGVAKTESAADRSPDEESRIVDIVEAGTEAVVSQREVSPAGSPKAEAGPRTEEHPAKMLPTVSVKDEDIAMPVEVISFAQHASKEVPPAFGRLVGKEKGSDGGGQQQVAIAENDRTG